MTDNSDSDASKSSRREDSRDSISPSTDVQARRTDRPEGDEDLKAAQSSEKISGNPTLKASRAPRTNLNPGQTPREEGGGKGKEAQNPLQEEASRQGRGKQDEGEQDRPRGRGTTGEDVLEQGTQKERGAQGRETQEGGHGRSEALRSTEGGTNRRFSPPKTPIEGPEVGSEPVSKSHDGGGKGRRKEVALERVEGDNDEEGKSGGEKPGGTLQSEVLGTRKELNIVEEGVDSAYDAASESYRKYRPVGRRILVHVYFCETKFAARSSGKGDFREEGVPIDHRLIQQACQDAGIAIPSSTEEVWAPLREAGFLIASRYIRREESPGRSRRFRLSRSLSRRLTEGAEEGLQKKSRYDLITGRRVRRTEKTELTYDGTHSWEGRSELIYQALKALQGQRDLLNKEAIQEHIDRLKAKQERLKARYETKKDAYLQLLKKCCTESEGGEWVLKDGVDEDTKERLNCLQEAACEAWERHRTAWARYQQDLRLWTKIRGQGLEPAPDQPPGIYQYETAYEVQEASGRLTMTAGLQNASTEMKAAAAEGISDYHNYDIASSQTEALKQELEMASEMETDPNVAEGPDVDPDALEEYPGKDSLARQYGIDRELWKQPEHAVKFGAGFTHESFEEALKAAESRVADRISGKDGELQWDNLQRRPHESGQRAWERAVYNKLPTMAQVAQDWAEDGSIRYDDPEAVYRVLREVYEEMAQALDQWREWLLEVHWSQEGRPGGDHGYFVENPCGLPFSIHEERLEEDGEPSPYKQKVAYATSRLQGLEAAYMHALAALAEEYGYEFLRNEHDGAVVLGKIPEEARKRARKMSGFERAKLEEKAFGGKSGSAEGGRSVVGDIPRSNTDESNAGVHDPPSPESDRPPSSSPRSYPELDSESHKKTGEELPSAQKTRLNGQN